MVTVQHDVLSLKLMFLYIEILTICKLQEASCSSLLANSCWHSKEVFFFQIFRSQDATKSETTWLVMCTSAVCVWLSHFLFPVCLRRPSKRQRVAACCHSRGSAFCLLSHLPSTLLVAANNQHQTSTSKVHPPCESLTVDWISLVVRLSSERQNTAVDINTPFYGMSCVEWENGHIGKW